MSVNDAAASRIAAASVARRAPAVRRRPATAPTTSARLRSGVEYTYNQFPIIPPMSDSWTSGRIANTAAIIRTMAPRRSDQGARLKKSHQRTMATED